MTDSVGRFRFELSARNGIGILPSELQFPVSVNDTRRYQQAMTCYLHGALKGYVSERVDFASLSGAHFSDIGTVVLRRVADPAKSSLSLVRLAAIEQKWQEVLDRSDAVLKLNPTELPEAYYYRAVAHYNLEHLDLAFEDAQQAVKLDASHTVPLAEQLSGVLFSMRGDYKSAAEQFRNYLQHVPPATNVAAVKALLAEAESREATSGK